MLLAACSCCDAGAVAGRYTGFQAPTFESGLARRSLRLRGAGDDERVDIYIHGTPESPASGANYEHVGLCATYSICPLASALPRLPGESRRGEHLKRACASPFLNYKADRLQRRRGNSSTSSVESASTL